MNRKAENRDCEETWFLLFVKRYAEVQELVEKGYSIERICRVTGIDEKEIRKYGKIADRHF